MFTITILYVLGVPDFSFGFAALLLVTSALLVVCYFNAVHIYTHLWSDFLHAFTGAFTVMTGMFILRESAQDVLTELLAL